MDELMEIKDKGKNFLPAIIKRQSADKVSVGVTYELVDASHYMFSFNLGENVSARFTESDSFYSHSETIDYDFDESLPRVEWPYYAFSAGIGFLTSVFASIKTFDKVLLTVNKWTDSKWGNTIIEIAKSCGLKKNDLKAAKKFLANRCVSVFKDSIRDDQVEVLRDYLRDLAKHPSLSGLIFSIITQFKGEKLSINDKEELEFTALPDYYAIGEGISQKLLYGIAYWIFNLVICSTVAKKVMLDDLNIPKSLVTIIKGICKSKLGVELPTNIQETERMFSEFLVKLFENTNIEEEMEEQAQDKNYNLFLNSIKSIAKTELEYCFPVLLNEALVRVFYSTYRISELVRDRNITTYQDLFSVKFEDLLPIDNRIILRMNTVSYSVFMIGNIGSGIIKALVRKHSGKGAFAKTLLTEINIPGLVRLIIAITDDMPHLQADVKYFFNRKFKKTASNKEKAGNTEECDISNDDIFEDTSFEEMELDPSEARALFSLEALSIRYDILNEKNSEKRTQKEEWLSEWKEMVIQGIEAKDDYFVEDEDILYKALFLLSNEKRKRHVFYLLYLELVLFKPYTALSAESDKEYNGLKYDNGYISEHFIRRQTVLSQDDADNVLKLYKKYRGIISGSTKKTILMIAASSVVTVATGGLAWAFAPGIAVTMAGSSLAGLHGIALTNAALATIGGGSLAAGGLGVAGGTAIIAGGGALIGLTSTGAAALTTLIGQAPPEQWIRLCAKLAVYSKTVLIDIYHEDEKVRAIVKKLSMLKERIMDILKTIEPEKNDLDAQLIKNLKDTIGYLETTEKEMEKLI